MRQRIILFLLFSVIAFSAWAQTPYSFNYQAIIRDGDTPIMNELVSVEINVFDGTDTSVFCESQNQMTNDKGMLVLEIGKGTPCLEGLSLIDVDWATGTYQIEIKVNTSQGEIMGKSPLNAVPFALHAATVEDKDDADADPVNEIQQLSKSGNQIILSAPGGGVFSTQVTDEVNDADADPTNELQDWNNLPGIPNDLLDGDQVNDSDSDPTNELQNWNNLPGIPNDILDGDQVNDADSDPTNELQNWNNLPGIPNDILDGDQVNDADSDPTNELQSWNNLPGIPADILDGDQVNDADHNPVNEIQTLSKNGNEIILDAPGQLSSRVIDEVDDADSDPTNELQNWNTLPGIPADILNGDQVNDADSDPTNELQNWNTLPGIPADILNGDQVNDADADPTNEIQGLSLNGNQLSLVTNGGTPSILLPTIWSLVGSTAQYLGGNVRGGFDISADDDLLAGDDIFVRNKVTIFTNNNNGGVETFGANGATNFLLSTISGNNNHGWLGLYNSDDQSRLRAFVSSSGAGGLITYGTNGNTNIYLDHISGNANHGWFGIYNSTGQSRLRATVISSGEGVIEAFGPNGNTNLRATTLVGNHNNGYFSVHDANGNLQAGIYVNSSGQGVVFGDQKNFRMDHPEQPGKEIWYASIEGPEAAAYERGKGKLENGEAFIAYSDHYQIVANLGTATFNLTPLSADTYGLAVVEQTEKGFKVKELMKRKGNFEFTWEVKAVRKGHENYRVIRDASEIVPLESNRSNKGAPNHSNNER